jgi:hypothetical protein
MAERRGKREERSGKREEGREKREERRGKWEVGRGTVMDGQMDGYKENSEDSNII